MAMQLAMDEHRHRSHAQSYQVTFSSLKSLFSLFLVKNKSWPFSQHVIFNNKNKNNHEMAEHNLPVPA